MTEGGQLLPAGDEAAGSGDSVTLAGHPRRLHHGLRNTRSKVKAVRGQQGQSNKIQHFPLKDKFMGYLPHSLLQS